ncbi:MAG: sulfonate ABC transporter substrate-binding protein [Zoogloeaceae bacterium]|jgi:sulfonate transport system substrate-binding protein|nr:sulfonate ABC transporter substrate-binding protein [Zoogloeaceae bacterium]
MRKLFPFIALLFTLGLAFTAAPLRAQTTAAKEFRVGWQKGSNLAILKARGNLDARLSKAGVKVRWIEFTAGPQMLEGLNVGSIDFACVGETPPVFAQAAGADLVYVANEPPAPDAEKVLVQKDSPIKSFAQLKGKRIALNRGSNVHYLLLKLLAREKLEYKDVQVVYLPPADARAAFENGSIDAWVIWDPFAEAAVGQIGARVLVEAKGLAENYNFYLSTAPFAKKHPEILKWAIEEVSVTGDWTTAHFDEAAKILAPQIGLSQAITKNALQHYGYGVKLGFPVGEKVIANQQAIADAFFAQKLIPKQLDIRSVIWKP